MKHLIDVMEKAALDRIFQTIRGARLLQIGGPSETDFIAEARFSQNFWVDAFYHAKTTRLLIQAHSDQLPIQPESIDVVLLLHQLSREHDVSTVLAEVSRVLKPNGHCIIIDFNAVSPHRLGQLKTKKCCSPFLIKRRLRRCDFEIILSKTLCFRQPLLPIKHEQDSVFIETLGQFIFSIFGAAFLIMAQKKLPGMTPLVIHQWKQKSLLPQRRAARWEPTTRV